MTMCSELRRVLISILLLGLAACASSPKPTKAIKPVAPARDWVSEIRAEAAAVPSNVEVLPLRDAVVDDLRAKAQAAETARKFNEAEASLNAALAIVPDDPALWQWRAEIALAERRFTDAIAHATRSAALGPKLGDLCVRNWLTLAAARHESKDVAGESSARAQAKACPVPAPIRM